MQFVKLLIEGTSSFNIQVLEIITTHPPTHHEELDIDRIILPDSVHPILGLLDVSGNPTQLCKDDGAGCSKCEPRPSCLDAQDGNATLFVFLEPLPECISVPRVSGAINANVPRLLP